MAVSICVPADNNVVFRIAMPPNIVMLYSIPSRFTFIVPVASTGVVMAIMKFSPTVALIGLKIRGVSYFAMLMLMDAILSFKYKSSSSEVIVAFIVMFPP